MEFTCPEVKPQGKGGVTFSGHLSTLSQSGVKLLHIITSIFPQVLHMHIKKQQLIISFLKLHFKK